MPSVERFFLNVLIRVPLSKYIVFKVYGHKMCSCRVNERPICNIFRPDCHIFRSVCHICHPFQTASVLYERSLNLTFLFQKVKQHWLGEHFQEEGHSGNDIAKSNVPDIRVSFRHETLLAELKILESGATGSRSPNN